MLTIKTCLCLQNILININNIHKFKIFAIFANLVAENLNFDHFNDFNENDFLLTTTDYGQKVARLCISMRALYDHVTRLRKRISRVD